MRHPSDTRRLVAGAAAWVGWAAALNLAWEIAQLPLYAFPPGTSASFIAFGVAHCTLGDATLALVSYGAAAAVTRRAVWPLEWPGLGMPIVLIVGVGWTIWAEWNAVYITRAWTYGARMPMIGGIGLSPLLQWIVLPLVVLTIVRASARRRRHRAGSFDF